MLEECGVDDAAVASDMVESPTISSASPATPASPDTSTFSFVSSAGSSGFGFAWKKPFKLFWPLVGAAFDVAGGVGFCFFVVGIADTSDAFRFFSGEEGAIDLEEAATTDEPTLAEDVSPVVCSGCGLGVAAARLLDEEADAAGAADFLNMSLMLLL